MSKSSFYILILIVISLSCETDEYEGSKSEWLQDAFNCIESNPEIKAISYWNENWEDSKDVHMKINSSSEALEVYRDNISKDYYVTEQVVKHKKVVAPPNGVYHSAYPGFSINNGTDEEVTAQKIEDFISDAGKPLAWVYFSNSWHKGIEFPTEDMSIISDEGYIPFVRMMPWSVVAPHLEQADEVFRMQKFIEGDFDVELAQWASDLKAFKEPVMIEFGTEVNGNWMPWNGQWNGGGQTSYGDPAYPDGPERFRDAYRHIIDLFDDLGAHNATWVFHVNYSKTPEDEWNDMHYYYPGDDYIDWIGVSIYGPLFKNQKWTYSFSEMYNYVEPLLQELSTDKPIAILEFGVGEI